MCIKLFMCIGMFFMLLFKIFSVDLMIVLLCLYLVFFNICFVFCTSFRFVVASARVKFVFFFKNFLVLVSLLNSVDLCCICVINFFIVVC